MYGVTCHDVRGVHAYHDPEVSQPAGLSSPHVNIRSRVGLELWKIHIAKI